MAGVARVQQQRFFSRIQYRQGQVGGALLGTHQQQHLLLGIHRYAKPLLHPLGRRLAEGQGGGIEAIGGAGWGEQSCRHGFQHRQRWRQVSAAQGEVQERSLLAGI